MWHNLPKYEILKMLQTHANSGLTKAQVLERRKEHGWNEIPRTKQRSWGKIFLHQFLSPLIYLLILAAAVALYLGERKDALVILVVVILNALIGSIQEGRAAQALEALRRLTQLKTRALRAGTEVSLEARELVPGDILSLSQGDAIPADARILEATSVFASEAALTGESLPVEKEDCEVSAETPLADRKNMFFAGTFLSSGRATAVVIATGAKNEVGKIAHLAATTEQPKTQLEIRIDKFGRAIAVVSIALFLLTLILGILRGIEFSKIFMVAISQMVSLVPEGLPVAMTIALAVGVQRMAKRGTIVRRLSAVETLGSTNVICTDKTGTLTKNEMTVTRLYLPDKDRHVFLTGTGYLPEGDFVENGQVIRPLSIPSLKTLLESCALCNDSLLLAPNSTHPHWNILGDPTEGALLVLAKKAHLDPEELKRQFPRTRELPFDSQFKLMATEHRAKHRAGHRAEPQRGDEPFVIIKGAPEVLLPMCQSLVFENEERPIDSHIRENLHKVLQEMTGSALRVLAFGYLKNEELKASTNLQSPFANLQGKVTLLGLIAQMDPPREEVSNSVQQCLRAGIRPVMVTGDHKATGVAVGRSLGIFQEGHLAIDGNSLDNLTQKDLQSCMDSVRVFARVHPTQKLQIVKTYQELGNIVAMTGDGVNDAPALVQANVGVAMGRTGTEVAKEAAKIIITDDNFSTIVTAISEGRLVYQNIKKLILFLFVTSVDEVLVLFLALLFGYHPPLAAVQILWINLVSEGVLTLNLIMEPPEGDEMARPPIPPREPLLDKEMLKRIPFMVSSSVISTFGWFLFRTKMGLDPKVLQTEVFTILVICQWFNVFNCRSSTLSAFSKMQKANRWLLGGLALGILLQILVIYWKDLGQFFHTKPIQIQDLILMILVASLVLWVEEIRKFVIRGRSHKVLPLTPP